MAEAAGLALALAPLFSTCMDLFDRFELAKNYRGDHRTGCDKLLLLKWRIIGCHKRLGCQASGLTCSGLEREWPDAIAAAASCLSGINATFSDASQLADKYSIIPRRKSAVVVHEKDAQQSSALANSTGWKLNSRLLFRRRTLWAVHDKGKFDNFLRDLEDLVGSLEKVFDMSDRWNDNHLSSSETNIQVTLDDKHKHYRNSEYRPEASRTNIIPVANATKYHPQELAPHQSPVANNNQETTTNGDFAKLVELARMTGGNFNKFGPVTVKNHSTSRRGHVKTEGELKQVNVPEVNTWESVNAENNSHSYDGNTTPEVAKKFVELAKGVAEQHKSSQKSNTG